MRREHVVVGGDDRQIGAVAIAQHRLVAGTASGETMGKIGAAEPGAAAALSRGFRDAIEIALARSRLRSRSFRLQLRNRFADGHSCLLVMGHQ